MGAVGRWVRVGALVWTAVLFSATGRAEVPLQELPVYGPEVFLRNPDATHPSVRLFTVARPAQSYLLRVQNGSPEGTNRASSAVVTVNNTVILTQTDFSQNVTFLERPVTLGAQDRLEVDVSGMPTSYLVVNFVGFYRPEDVDDDGDGYTETEGDCDDANGAIHPGPQRSATGETTTARDGSTRA